MSRKTIALFLALFATGAMIAACARPSESQPVAVGTYPTTTTSAAATTTAPRRTATYTAPTTTAANPPPSSAPALSARDIGELAYIATLNSRGIPTGTPAVDRSAIKAGHAICDALDAGATPLQVARAAAESSSFSRADSAYIVGAAIGSLCQRHAGLVDTAAGVR